MKIHTLTINGNTFEIADPAVEPLSQTVSQLNEASASTSEAVKQLHDDSDAVWQNIDQLVEGQKTCVLTVAQTLTDEQKTQARKNIGAMEEGYIIPLCIGNEDYWIIDSSFDALWDDLAVAAKSKRYIACRYCFTASIYDNSTVYYFPLTYIDYEEKYAAFSCVFGDHIWGLTLYADESNIIRVDNESKDLGRYSLDDMIHTITEHTEALGDIEAALDSIIAIQENLIGGTTE